jgi:hypothetical protein
MIIVSLLLNIAVLIPVTTSLLRRAQWTDSAFGERTPARDILLSIYIAILLASVCLLIGQFIAADAPWLVGAVSALLFVQVVYKVTTVIAVRQSLRNPVVLSNIGIAVVHSVTIAVILLGNML